MIFISILTLIIAKAISHFNREISNVGFTRLASIVLIFSGVLSFNTLYIQSIGSGIGIYSGLFHITTISQLIEVFLLFIGSLILVAWPLLSFNKTSLTKENGNDTNTITHWHYSDSSPNTYKKGVTYATDYSLIILFSTLGSCLLISCSDLISLYLAIELQSFGLYTLATLFRNSESSTSAGLKYFLLGGLSSCIILLGAGLVYSYSGITNFESLYILVSASSVNSVVQGIGLGLILIIIGFLFKIAAAPLHNWSPDVYDETPTIVTIWLTIMPKIAIIILLLELHTQLGGLGVVSLSSLNEIIPFISLNNLSSTNSIDLLKEIILLSSILSLIIGTVVGLAQTRIKRLLAYSTISHIGFMLLALAINTQQSVDSLLFYLIQYSLTNLNVFLIIIALSYVINSIILKKNSITPSSDEQTNSLINNTENIDIRYISDFKGQFFANPLLSLSLAICLFSMAGIPPLMGFFSKQFVLYSAIQNGYNFISIVGIIVSVVSASYYLKVIKVLHTEGAEGEIINEESVSTTTGLTGVDSSAGTTDSILTNFHSYLISVLTLSILLFIFKPTLILNSTQLLSLSIFNY